MGLAPVKAAGPRMGAAAKAGCVQMELPCRWRAAKVTRINGEGHARECRTVLRAVETVRGGGI